MDPEAPPSPPGTPPDDEVRSPELPDVSKARSCPGGSLVLAVIVVLESWNARLFPCDLGEGPEMC